MTSGSDLNSISGQHTWRAHPAPETDLDERVAAIEARQRAYEMHDQWCPALAQRRAAKLGLDVLLTGDCECWLRRK